MHPNKSLDPEDLEVGVASAGVGRRCAEGQQLDQELAGVTSDGAIASDHSPGMQEPSAGAPQPRSSSASLAASESRQSRPSTISATTRALSSVVGPSSQMHWGVRQPLRTPRQKPFSSSGYRLSSSSSTPTISRSHQLLPSSGSVTTATNFLQFCEPQPLVPESVLEALFVEKCVQAPGDQLDRKVAASFTRISNTQTWKIFCSRSPFTTAISARWCQMVGCIMVLAYIYNGRTHWDRTYQSVVASYPHFRMTLGGGQADQFMASSFDSGGISAGNSSVFSWGLLRDRCPLEGVNVSIHRNNTSSVISFSEVVRVNGLWLRIPKRMADLSGGTFRLEGSRDANVWEELADSTMCRFQHKTDGILNVDSTKRLMLDWTALSCLWPDLMATSYNAYVGAVFGVVLLMFGAWGQGRTGTLVFCWGVFICCAMVAIGMIAFVIRGREISVVIDRLVIIVAYMIWPVCMIWFEELSFGLASIGSAMVMGQSLWFYWEDVDARIFPFGPTISFMVVAILFAIRWRIVTRAIEAVQLDLNQFESEWQTLMADPSVVSDILRLEQFLDVHHVCNSSRFGDDPTSTGHAAEATIVNHLTRDPVQSLGSADNGNALYYGQESPQFNKFLGGMQHGTRVNSLDQVYMMSSIIQPILRYKVQAWALSSMGCLRFKKLVAAGEDKGQVEVDMGHAKSQDTEQKRRSGSEGRWSGSNSVLRNEQISGDAGGSQECHTFMPYALIKGDESAESRIIWTAQKGVQRSIDKLASSYCNEVYRLLDVTRELIAFDSVKDLKRCVEEVISDPDCTVLRVKNRLSNAHDSRLTAGWRDVTMILQIRTEETRHWGVDGHCCELQLALKSFVKYRVKEQHDRYLQFREIHGYRYSNIPQRLGQAVLHGFSPFTKNLRKLGSGRNKEFVIGREASGSGTRHLLPSFQAEKGKINGNSVVHKPDVEENAGTVPEPQYQDASHLKGASEAESLDTSENGEVDESECHSIRETLQQRCRWPGGVLGAMLSNDHPAHSRASTGAVLDASKPITAALSKRFIQVCLFLSLIVGLWLEVRPRLIPAIQGYVVQASHFRMVLLSHRDGSAAGTASQTAIQAFGILKDGCHIARRPEGVTFNHSTSGSTFQFSTSDPVQIDGWYFETSNGPTGMDPVMFRFETSTDGLLWDVRGVGSCSYAWNLTYFPPVSCHRQASSYNTTTVRRARELFDLRLPWHGELSFLGPHAFLVPTVALGTVLATMQQPGMAKQTLICGMIGCGLTLLSAGYGSVLETDGSSSLFPVLWGLESLLLGAVVSVERWVPQFFLFHGVAMQLINGGHNVLVFGDFRLGSDAPPMGGTYLVFIVLLMYLLRLVASERAKRRISREKLEFDMIWDQLRTEALDQLNGLEHLIGVVHQASEEPRQRVRNVKNRVSSFFLKHAQEESWAAQKEPSVVENLDQLFAHAAGNHKELKRKSQVWALASKGCFALKQEASGSGAATTVPGYVQFGVAREDPTVLKRIRWSALKRIDRAIEKLSRSYMSDVSRLLDLCRECLIFENIDDMMHCIEVISRDLEVEILRIKNRLGPGQDASDTAGYRFVLINLRLVTAETTRLGVDGHVCELQLVLSSFWKAMTTAGHLKYVSWRNSRGK